MTERNRQPFAKLGAKLKLLRERKQESLEDASGAVEIDAPMLQAFEEGKERPAEDTLHVLLHHFDVQDDVAEEVWGMAGYTSPHDAETGSRADSSTKYQSMPAMFVLPLDNRILYSDSVQVNANRHGVILSFIQNVGSDNKPLPVSRIGMSREHAEHLLTLLSDCLTNSDPDHPQPPAKTPTDKQG